MRLAGALALAAMMAACRNGNDDGPVIQTAAAERRDIVVEAEATGVIEPINVVEVKSKASGQITAMPVETGMLVRPGDLLVQVDTRDVRNQYNQALADVRATQAAVEVQSAQRRRSDELVRQGIITAQEFETTALAYENARAALARSRANLDIAQQRLEDATVRAPVAGTIIDKEVSLGQVITSATGAFGGGTTLLKMANLEQVRVRAMVTETDIGSVRPGQTVRVTVDAYPQRPFQGTVEKVEPQAVVLQSVTMFPVLVSVSNRDGLLMPGMNGEVSILVAERTGVLAVPNDAVRNPRDAALVATALGLNPDEVRRQLARGRTATGPAPANGDVRVQISRGEIGPEFAPAEEQGEGQRQGQRQTRGAQQPGGAAPQGRPRSATPQQGETPAQRQGDAPQTAPLGNGGAGAIAGGRGRTGVVFVATGNGYEPRMVRLGVSNYDYTEVVSGLEEGEHVALLAVATLQQQRAERLDRMRNMTGGGGVPGMQRQGAGR